MEREIVEEFDFRKKEIQEIEKKPKITVSLLKKMKFISFLIIGGLSIGAGLGVSNTLMQGYIVNKHVQGNVAEIVAKNEEFRKNAYYEFQLKKTAAENIITIKENSIQEAKQQGLLMQEDKYQYNILSQNSRDMIKNYESQIGLYDKAYQSAVKNVKTGLISLDDLNEIRELYQSYKKEINESINFFSKATVNFDTYHNVSEEDKKALTEELISYQSGGLNKSVDLESALVQKISDNSDDEEDDQLTKNRVIAKNNMIQAISDIMRNDTAVTVSKKLKR